MIRTTLLMIVVAASLGVFVYSVALAAPNVQKEDPDNFKLLIAVLEDAYLKGLLSDSLSEALSDWFIDDLIEPHTSETRNQVLDRLGDSFLGPVLFDDQGQEIDRIAIYGSRYWFSLLIAAVEDAHSKGTLDNALAELLSDWFVDNLIGPETGETGEQARERLSASREPARIFGTLANPVPLGTAGLVSGRLAVAITSTNLNATDVVGSLGAPPAPGNRYVIVHVNFEDVSDVGYAHEIRHSDLGLIGSSGRIIRNSPYQDKVCGGALERLGYRSSLGRGESLNTVLCFEVPEDEEGLILFYESIPRYLSGSWILGFWAVSVVTTPPAPAETRAISDTYGTRATPVPLRELGLASDGIAVAVLSANLNANQELEDAPGYYPIPAQGKKFVTINARVQALTGREGDLYDRYHVRGVSAYDFILITSSGLVITGTSYEHCSFAYDIPQNLDVFKVVWLEADL
ncbi:MAG: hypothetical protein F4Z35_07725 [Dehalococcoidia bacterium]|nr:hypothetical protein [Dehalococcoidia bacterium]